MANTKTLDYGWFFLRLSIGLIFLQTGANEFNARDINLFALATLICGTFLVIGFFVRPAVIFMLVMMISIFVRGSSLSISLVRESVIELLALIGFLIGGGGSFLALGAAISGLSGKWYQ